MPILLFRPVAIVAVMLGLIVATAMPLRAEDPLSRTELSRTDLTGSQTLEVVMSRIHAAPGAVMPRHIHHGDEYVYVVSGGSVETADGGTMTLETGSTIHFPRAVPHGGFTVIGDDTIEVLTVHVVDKDKPLMELVE